MARNIFQNLYYKDLQRVYKKFDGLVLDNAVQDIPDLQGYFERIHKKISTNKRILISYHNHFWEPILNLASNIGLRKKVGLQNWISGEDLENILHLSGFEIISTKKRFFGITIITIARPNRIEFNQKSYSVSIIVPARNEEGNISKIVPSIPKFGKWQEIIFVEGNSTDQTWSAISNLQFLTYKQNSKSKKSKFKRIVKAYKQKGRGKADAVKLGFEKAKGDILIIYDADRTVEAKDLPRFYNALSSNLGEFANGSRLIYPMENQAMQTLNKIGNKLFSSLFTWILGQRFKDTLCGTKALFRKDYIFMKKHNKKYFEMDPFGDFALIFGAIKNNIKVIEIPVRYKERVYGTTNISRFRHGLILMKMTVAAFREFSF
jgi:hypothetical protein